MISRVPTFLNTCLALQVGEESPTNLYFATRLRVFALVNNARGQKLWYSNFVDVVLVLGFEANSTSFVNAQIVDFRTGFNVNRYKITR